jgi:hypothetical protein
MPEMASDQVSNLFFQIRGSLFRNKGSMLRNLETEPRLHADEQDESSKICGVTARLQKMYIVQSAKHRQAVSKQASV